jgi:cysteine desulfurase/selenocysteine lyase
MHFYGVPATCRASLAFYNTHEEVEAFIAALRKVRTLLA